MSHNDTAIPLDLGNDPEPRNPGPSQHERHAQALDQIAKRTTKMIEAARYTSGDSDLVVDLINLRALVLMQAAVARALGAGVEAGR